jgi:hypothetical protein
MKNTRRIIMDTVSDIIANFLYYHRKEDEDLRVGEIESAIKNGEITVDEIVEKFRTSLLEGLDGK